MLRNLKSLNLPELEEKVLALWKEKHIFEKTCDVSRAGAHKKLFRFWEGPPTANGRPGLHHVLARSFKDVVLRYKTMRGYTVPRRAGWDTHGLPVELQVEKQLGLSSKKDIEAYGVALFNQKCKESVWQYKSEWEKLTERMGFWLDMRNPYVTYENEYIEKLWNVIKHIHTKKFLYYGHKIVPWCSRCGTALSSHELAQGYKTVKDESVYVKFKVKGGGLKTKEKIKIPGHTYILSWTTTPWTLPGNVALAVGSDVLYGLFSCVDTKEHFILALCRADAVLGEGKYKKIKEFKGKELAGLFYEPLFHVQSLVSDTSYTVYEADFVTAQDGTGIVHTAVMYGEDDYVLGKHMGLPQVHTVDESGKFTKDVKGYDGLYVKDQKTEEKLFAQLRRQNNFLRSELYEHEYPHCWRCSTPLIYYARGSWLVQMSKLKKELCAANKKISWVPEHIKDGRFGEWLQDIKDWNFSRERYWGTPLPIWTCDSCDHKEVIGGLAEFSKRANRKNKFFIMRHGQATSNVEGWMAGGKESGAYISKLTSRGIKEVEKTASALAKKSIDIIYASPYHRTKETARIVSKLTGAKVIFDARLGEIDSGIFNRKKVTDRSLFYTREGRTRLDAFTVAPKGGETLSQVRARAISFLKDISSAHYGKNVLIVSHGDPLWMLQVAVEHLSDKEAMHSSFMMKTGESRELAYDYLPMDASGCIALHRPYVDEARFACTACKSGCMKRVPEVADVWFDSGAMPIASGAGYPADYICEAMDQTRGWFYTLLAVSVLMGIAPPPYKQVICLGLIHDKNGQKMSKSKGNVVDPWVLMQKYGVDALRWHFFTMNDPGESKNFDEQDVLKVVRRLMLVVYNSFSFLHLYGKKGISLENTPCSNHPLDTWMMRRIEETTRTVLEHMDTYNILRAAATLETYIDDLSRWYIRRSRRRLQKNEDGADWEVASATLAYALLCGAKLLAPFVPFFGEALFQSLRKEYKGINEESVHLTVFPIASKQEKDDGFMEAMRCARDMASAVLAQRAQAQIKVRQPLATLFVKKLPVCTGPRKLLYQNGIIEILKDEINVKDIVEKKDLSPDFELDTHITPELKSEGLLRELVRTVQDLRQNAGYVPKDKITVWISGSKNIELLAIQHTQNLVGEIGAREIFIGKNEKVDIYSETKLDEYKTWVGIRRSK